MASYRDGDIVQLEGHGKTYFRVSEVTPEGECTLTRISDNEAHREIYERQRLGDLCMRHLRN